MATDFMQLIENITDETTFLRFLTAFRKDCERSERECPTHDRWCQDPNHWESLSTKDFLRSAEDWGTRGDFGEGVHHGEPILRRIATMLFVGRFRVHESDQPDR